MHSLKLVEAREEPVGTGQRSGNGGQSLDATGRDQALRAAAVRAVVSHDELPVIEYQEGPLLPLDIPRMAIIDKPGLYAVIYLGDLRDMLAEVSDMIAPPGRSGWCPRDRGEVMTRRGLRRLTDENDGSGAQVVHPVSRPIS